MHSYINPSLVKDFTSKYCIGQYANLIRSYKLTNINGDEAFNELCHILYADYLYGRANIMGYAEKGMNLRMLAELRKSAVLDVAPDTYYFYTDLAQFNTWKEVRNYRMRFFQRFNQDYLELGWQYYYLVKYMLNKKAENFVFDFESLFADGNPAMQTNIEHYHIGMLNAHVPSWARQDGYKEIVF